MLTAPSPLWILFEVQLLSTGFSYTGWSESRILVQTQRCLDDAVVTSFWNVYFSCREHIWRRVLIGFLFLQVAVSCGVNCALLDSSSRCSSVSLCKVCPWAPAASSFLCLHYEYTKLSWSSYITNYVAYIFSTTADIQNAVIFFFNLAGIKADVTGSREP